MLTVTVRLLHETIRAASPDNTVPAGDTPDGEWPPSPARLFSALVAADATQNRCIVTTGEELYWLESLDPPVIHASPADAVEQSALQPRYVVVDETSKAKAKAKGGAVQNYPARQAKEVRPGVRSAPRDPRVVYVWSTAVPSDVQLEALRYRAARVGYLGCSDSPVQVTVGTDIVPTGESWQPDPSSAMTLPVPYPGFVENLDTAFAMWSAGQALGRAWIPTRRAGYRPPGAVTVELASSRSAIWMRFDRSLSGRAVLLVSWTMRAAITDHIQRLVDNSDYGAAAEALVLAHGHRHDGAEVSQADFIALPDVAHSRAAGRLFGAAVCFPKSTDPAVVDVLRSAVFGLSREGLFLPDGTKVGVAVFGGQERPWASNPRNWTARARRWISVTPVIHERWTKHGPTPAELERWLHHAGLDFGDISPGRLVTSVDVSRRPLIAGALDLAPSLMFREGKERRPYSHMRVTFSQPIRGPLVIGRGRQLGFGLLAPERDHGAAGHH